MGGRVRRSAARARQRRRWAFFSSLLGLPAATVALALGACGSAMLQPIPPGQAVAAARRGEVTALVRAVLARGR